MLERGVDPGVGLAGVAARAWSRTGMRGRSWGCRCRPEGRAGLTHPATAPCVSPAEAWPHPWRGRRPRQPDSGASSKSTLPMCRFMDFISSHTPTAIAAKTMKPRTPGVTLFSSISFARGDELGAVPGVRSCSGIAPGCPRRGRPRGGRYRPGTSRARTPRSARPPAGPPSGPGTSRRRGRSAWRARSAPCRGSRRSRRTGTCVVSVRSTRSNSSQRSSHSAVRRLHAAVEQRLVQRDGARPVEALVVVELLRLEDRAVLGLRVLLGVGRASKATIEILWVMMWSGCG